MLDTLFETLLRLYPRNIFEEYSNIVTTLENILRYKQIQKYSLLDELW